MYSARKKYWRQKSAAISIQRWVLARMKVRGYQPCSWEYFDLIDYCTAGKRCSAILLSPSQRSDHDPKGLSHTLCGSQVSGPTQSTAQATIYCEGIHCLCAISTHIARFSLSASTVAWQLLQAQLQESEVSSCESAESHPRFPVSEAYYKVRHLFCAGSFKKCVVNPSF